MDRKKIAEKLLDMMERGEGEPWDIVQIVTSYLSGSQDEHVARRLLEVGERGDRQKLAVIHYTPAIYKIVPEQTESFLLRAIKDSNEEIRRRAKSAVKKIAFAFQRGDLLKTLIEVLEQEGCSSRWLLQFVNDHEGITRFGLPADSRAKVVEVINRALSSPDENTRLDALHLASGIGFCDEVVEREALSLSAQYFEEALEASYILGIHKKHPEHFLNLDHSQIKSAHIRAYASILGDLTKINELAWNRLAEFVRSRIRENGGWILLYAVERVEKTTPLFWELLWEVIDNYVSSEWKPLLVDEVVRLIQGDGEAVEEMLAALKHESARRRHFAENVMTELVSSALNREQDL